MQHSDVKVSPEALIAIATMPFTEGVRRMACVHAAAQIPDMIFLITIKEECEAAVCADCRDSRDLRLVDVDEEA